MTNQQLVLHLSLIQKIGPVAIEKIVTGLASFLPDSYQLDVNDWIQLGFSPAYARILKDGLADKLLLERELALIEKSQSRLCTLLDADYPERLRTIYAPPAVFYYQGSIDDIGRSLAFIGSRNANQYAQRAIEMLIPELVEHSIAIVSGGAIGADSMAHRAALAARGRTVAVLGSGLLKKYPYRNRQLFEEIIERQGAVVSIFPLMADPLPGNFTARNRIIAGLSDGVVVVQAAAQSGTRTTAQFALEQGRDVFAIPGSIEDPLSAGCHALISQGAHITSSVHDILSQYGLVSSPIDSLKDNQTLPLDIKREKSVSLRYPGDSLEQHILQLCTIAQSLDEIAQTTNKNLVQLQATLFQMQLDGAIEQDFTGLWRATA